MGENQSKPSENSAIELIKFDGRTYEYNVKNVLGQGSFGTVFRGRQKNDKSKQDIAIKRVNSVSQSRSFLGHMNEITICNELRKLSSKYLVTILDVIVDDERTYIVMELISGGSLTQYLSKNGTFQPWVIWRLAFQITWGLVELNKIKIVHRDIKPDNILVAMNENGTVTFKLTDFGVSRFLTTQSMASILTGTPGYYAPEAITDVYDYRCDVFSLGIVLLECVCGKYPFDGVNSHSYGVMCSTNQLEAVIQRTLQQSCIQDRELSKLVTMMLQIDMSQRYNIETLSKHIASKANPVNDNLLIRILYYCGFKDRVEFQRVNKKWRQLLKFVWNPPVIPPKRCLKFTRSSIPTTSQKSVEQPEHQNLSLASNDLNNAFASALGRQVRTLYACTGENSSELSFAKNVIITNVRQSNEPGWLEGICDGKFGLIPENYVEFVKNIDTEKNE